MGTFFQTQERESCFQLQLMKEIGYDVVSFGNHEFDFSTHFLLQMLNKVSKEKMPLLTLSNIESDLKNNSDDDFQNLFDKNIINKYVILKRGGLKIGIFGLLGKDAYAVCPDIKPLKFVDNISTAKSIVKILKNVEKVDFVICLSHCGVQKNKKNEWVGEDVELAKKVQGINLIVGGHTHTKLSEPIFVNDIPIVQTGCFGENIGRMELNIKNNKILSSKYQLIKVDDKIQGNLEIQNKIDEQIDKINENILNKLELDYHKVFAVSNFDLICEENNLQNSNLGPFLSDAVYYYINNFSQRKTDVSLIAYGVIRNNISKGNISASDIFKTVGLGSGFDNVPGYPLVQVFVTAKDLKDFYEFILIACEKENIAHCYFTNIDFVVDNSKRKLHKVQKIKIGDLFVDFSGKNEKLYSVSCDLLMLKMISQVKKLSHGFLKPQVRDEKGNIITDFSKVIIDFDNNTDGIQEGKEWIAVVKYLLSFDKENGISAVPNKYQK
ncbi:MAG: metallophosphoesterase [Bacteroidales bacterium]|jgi:5'-nucleotidase|nr:metallophosphoesterase [Bacteroidales bacterium]